MLLLALPAAELLVSPAVSDLISTLKACRDISCMVLILHNSNISMPDKIEKGTGKFKLGEHGLSFSL
jgi:hypothetical protein